MLFQVEQRQRNPASYISFTGVCFCSHQSPTVMYREVGGHMQREYSRSDRHQDVTRCLRHGWGYSYSWGFLYTGTCSIRKDGRQYSMKLYKHQWRSYPRVNAMKTIPYKKIHSLMTYVCDVCTYVHTVQWEMAVRVSNWHFHVLQVTLSEIT